MKLAEQNGLDVGQLLQSWAVQRGTVPLGKSQTEGQYARSICLILSVAPSHSANNVWNLAARIKSNLAVRKLSPEDMAALDALELPDGKGRTIDYSDAWGVHLFTN